MKVSDLQGLKVVSEPKTSVAEMNNPFNIKVGSDTSQYISQGNASVGNAAPDGGNFLKFKDRNTAIDAAKNLLFSSGVYKGLTVDAALKKWSNNGYGGNIIPSLATSSIDSLTPEQQTQVLNAMEVKGENDAIPSGVKTVANAGPLTVVRPAGQKPTLPPSQTPFQGTFGAIPPQTGKAPALPFQTGVNVMDKTGQQSSALLKGAANLLTSSEQAAGQDIAGVLPAAKSATDMATKAAQSLNTEQQKVVQQIKTDRAAGKDASRLVSALQKSMGNSLDLTAINPALGKSNLDVILDFAGVGADVLSAGTYGTAAKGMEAGKLALPLAKTPTAISVAGRGVEALQQRSLAKETAKITDALTPKLPPTKYKAAGKLGQLTAPGFRTAAGVAGESVQSVKDSVQAVYNVAKDLGKKATSIIRPSSSATGNLNRVLGAISDHAQTIIKPFLSENKVPVNFENFIDYMKNVNPTGAIKASDSAFPEFNRVRERIIQTVYNSLKASAKKTGSFGAIQDLGETYWPARKTIDSIIDEELGAKTLSDPAITGIKAAAKTLRAGVADFISDSLRFPGQMEKVAVFRNTVNGMKEKGMELGDAELKALADQMGLKATGAKVASRWDSLMKDSNGLYKAAENLLTKAPKEQGKTSFKLFIDKHPAIMHALGRVGRAAEWGVGVGLGYEGLRETGILH